MTVMKFVFSAMVLALLSGCMATSNVVVDETFDFTSLSTFKVKNKMDKSIELPTTLLYADLITERLIEKGLTPEVATPDVEIVYAIYFGEEKDPSTLSIGLGTGNVSRSGSISIGTIFSVPVGNDVIAPLILNISVLKDGKEVWFNADRININKNDLSNYPNQQKALVEKVLAPLALKKS